MWDSDPSSRSPALVPATADDETENEGDGEEEGQGASEEEAAVALATAQSILTAADITLPTGDLAQGAYDALGNYYALPEYVVSDPLNISTQSGSKEDGGGMRDPKGELAGGDETGPGEGDIDGDDEAERRREEKGKAVVDVRDQILIRARLSDGSQDVNISVGKADSVRSIARRIAEEAQVSTVFGGLDGSLLNADKSTSSPSAKEFGLRTWARFSRRARRYRPKGGKPATLSMRWCSIGSHVGRLRMMASIYFLPTVLCLGPPG